MRMIKYLLLMLIGTVAVLGHAETTTNWPTTLQVGGVNWKLGYKQENAEMLIVEYVMPKETVDNWTELLTFQKTKTGIPINATPKMFAEAEVKEISSTQKVWDSIVEISSREAILEFRILEPKPEQQDELQRIMRTADDQIVIMHYVIRKEDMGDAARTKWTAALRAIDFDKIQQQK